MLAQRFELSNAGTWLVELSEFLVTRRTQFECRIGLPTTRLRSAAQTAFRNTLWYEIASPDLLPKQ